MSRTKRAVDFGESPRSPIMPTELLASAHTCAQRLQLSVESHGGASSLLLLTGVGAGVATSCLTGIMTNRRLGLEGGL